MAWMVAQTRSSGERLAVAHLRMSGFKPYCPRYLDDQKRERFLFPRYLFVKLTEAWELVRRVQYIDRVLLAPGNVKPGSIPHRYIQGLIRLQDGFGRIRLFDRNAEVVYYAGQHVKIVQGRFSGMEATFQLYKDKSADDRIVVLLGLLGQEARVELDRLSVAPIQ